MFRIASGKRLGWMVLLPGLALFASSALGQEPNMRFQNSRLDQVDQARKENGRAFLEFLRVADMSAGLYVLGPQDVDRQSPHGEDEIYYVVSGKGVLNVDGEDIPVAEESVVYVKARVPHHFHSIESELKVLVVFAPAFGSSGKGDAP